MTARLNVSVAPAVIAGAVNVGFCADALTALQVEALAVASGTLPTDQPRRRTHGRHGAVPACCAAAGVLRAPLVGLAALRVVAFDPARRRLTVSAAVVEVDGSGLVWGGHGARWVPVEPILAAELAVFVEGRDPGALLFTAPGGGVLRNRNARRSWFDRATASIGVPGLRPHELRHTAASLAVSAGANVKAVQRMLGHASAAITLDVYADLFPDDLEAVGAALSAVRARAGVAPALPGPVADSA